MPAQKSTPTKTWTNIPTIVPEVHEIEIDGELQRYYLGTSLVSVERESVFKKELKVFSCYIPSEKVGKAIALAHPGLRYRETKKNYRFLDVLVTK